MKKYLILLSLASVILLAWLMLNHNKQKTVIIYTAKGVVSMQNNAIDKAIKNGKQSEGPLAKAVAVKGGRIIGIGNKTKLINDWPTAKVDNTFANQFILPGFIDPHIHMLLSGIQYSLPMAPPWPIATSEGKVDGLPNREAFLKRLREIEVDQQGQKPLIIYGYHDLVHGDIDRHDLDAITTKRPLIVWHYSSHDFYLNTAALKWAKIDASLHSRFEGVPLGDDGLPTGRVFEDALPYLYETVGKKLLNPFKVRSGLKRFSTLLRQGGVTTVAELGYGLFGLNIENLNIILNWWSPTHSGYHLYLVPEHRSFEKAYGEQRVQKVLDMASGKSRTPAPVLPQVKFFADAAFYSQTMRLEPPGYLDGQSKGTQGLWVIEPQNIAPSILPYWQAGLGVRIHSNGDAAQTATLNALNSLRQYDKTQRFVIEHGGLIAPQHVQQAAELDAVISAASHYVYYLGDIYQSALGTERGNWISPLSSLSKAGVPVTLHSDAPLAPPLPLQAASVHLTRATREGGVLTPSEKLSHYEALEAITINAAFAMGLESEIGSIEAGKRADFTILSSNPLDTPGTAWPDIEVWGVLINGKKIPAPL